MTLDFKTQQESRFEQYRQQSQIIPLAGGEHWNDEITTKFDVMDFAIGYDECPVAATVDRQHETLTSVVTVADDGPCGLAYNIKHLGNRPSIKHVSGLISSVRTDISCSVKEVSFALEDAQTRQLLPCEVVQGIGRFIDSDTQAESIDAVGNFTNHSVWSSQLKQGASKLGGYGVFTKGYVEPGEILIEFHGVVTTEQDEHVLTIGRQHYLHDTASKIADYVNHSHAPNAWVDYRAPFPQLRALRRILPGEEVTFDYNTSDWDLGDLGFGYLDDTGKSQRVVGFSRLPEEEQHNIAKVMQSRLPSFFNLHNENCFLES